MFLFRFYTHPIPAFWGGGVVQGPVPLGTLALRRNSSQGGPPPLGSPPPFGHKAPPVSHREGHEPRIHTLPM
jgi:hypothetical protein